MRRHGPWHLWVILLSFCHSRSFQRKKTVYTLESLNIPSSPRDQTCLHRLPKTENPNQISLAIVEAWWNWSSWTGLARRKTNNPIPKAPSAKAHLAPIPEAIGRCPLDRRDCNEDMLDTYMVYCARITKAKGLFVELPEDGATYRVYGTFRFWRRVTWSPESWQSG